MLDKLFNLSVPWLTHQKKNKDENDTIHFNKIVIKIHGHRECKMLCKLRK